MNQILIKVGLGIALEGDKKKCVVTGIKDGDVILYNITTTGEEKSPLNLVEHHVNSGTSSMSYLNSGQIQEAIYLKIESTKTEIQNLEDQINEKRKIINDLKQIEMASERYYREQESENQE